MSESLHQLALRAGLEVEWTDVANRRHTVSPETLRAVLGALGHSAGSDRDIADCHAKLDEESRTARPVVTAWAGEKVPAASAGHAVIELESGESRSLEIVEGSDGHCFFVAPPEPGYHRILCGGIEQRLAVAPQRCFEIADARLPGLAVQIYSLRGGHSAGFGDFVALGELAADAAAQGIDALAVSPTHALSAADHARYSPYSPSTRLFLDPIYADPALCGGAWDMDDGKDGLIDWARASVAKWGVLHRAYEKFRGLGDARFDEFREKGGRALRRHATFEALEEHFCARGLGDWRRWPEAFRDPQSPAVAEFARANEDRIAYRKFLQWLAAMSADAAQQRAREGGMRVGLIADIAVGMDPCGSHAWSAPHEVLLGVHLGAPPDIFNPAGQDWGLTALSPRGIAGDGYEGFIATLRSAMAFAGGVRIDHAMGLRRLWLMPEGARPKDGVYLRYPFDDLLRLLALESHRNRAIVIGEDLGTVPEGFRTLLHNRGIAGMQVLWFERENGRFLPPDRWDRDAAAMTTTHDLPTVAGWWGERDIDWLVALGRPMPHGSEEAERAERARDRALLWDALARADLAAGEPPPAAAGDSVVEAALAYVGRAPSKYALAAVEDILALREQPNLPGTNNDESPNWRRRLPPGRALAGADAQRRLAAFTRARGK